MIIFKEVKLMGIVIVLIILLVVFLIWFLIKHKRLKLDCITLVVGAPKTGKTTIQVYLAIKDNKKRIFKTKFKNLFRNKKNKLPLPLLYSNIPLKYPHVRLTSDLLLRKERFVYNSTILISETSLVADSMAYKNEVMGDVLTYFYKLIGHELHGGAVYVETQNPSDNHYSLKRCINRYLFIYHLTKWIPFILIARVREFAYLEGVEGVNNNFNEDIEESMKMLFIPKSIWKKFDAYTYSVLTDDLYCNDNVIQPNEVETLKTKDILSLKDILNKSVKRGGK